MNDNDICEHGFLRSACGQEHGDGIYETRDEELERLRAYGTTVRLTGETWTALQALGYGFRGDELGTPDKVIAKLVADSDARFVLDALGFDTLADAKAAVDLARLAVKIEQDPRTSLNVRNATAAEIAEEQDGVLESLANGDLNATEATRHLAQAELEHRRQRAAR